MAYRLHSVSLFNDAMGAAVVFPDVGNLAFPQNPSHLASIVAATATPTHAAISGVQPAMTFSSGLVASGQSFFK